MKKRAGCCWTMDVEATVSRIEGWCKVVIWGHGDRRQQMLVDGSRWHHSLCICHSMQLCMEPSLWSKSASPSRQFFLRLVAHRVNLPSDCLAKNSQLNDLKSDLTELRAEFLLSLFSPLSHHHHHHHRLHLRQDLQPWHRCSRPTRTHRSSTQDTTTPSTGHGRLVLPSTRTCSCTPSLSPTTTMSRRRSTHSLVNLGSFLVFLVFVVRLHTSFPPAGLSIKLEIAIDNI